MRRRLSRRRVGAHRLTTRSMWPPVRLRPIGLLARRSAAPPPPPAGWPRARWGRSLRRAQGLTLTLGRLCRPAARRAGPAGEQAWARRLRRQVRLREGHEGSCLQHSSA